ncbi:MAG: hypothetical protein NVS3B20_21590 [Polyangiales bacterium]
MVVVTIIGLFTAMAGPTIVSTLQDRHASRGAEEISNLFRRARTRAASYGAAHIVRVLAVSGTQRFELRMAVDPVTGSPNASCMTTTWATAGGDNLLIDVVDFANGPRYQGQGINVTGNLGDYCMTPGGTPWGMTPGGIWTRPTGSFNLGYTVSRTDSSGVAFGIVRNVVIGVSGIPRITAQQGGN